MEVMLIQGKSSMIALFVYCRMILPIISHIINILRPEWNGWDFEGFQMFSWKSLVKSCSKISKVFKCFLERVLLSHAQSHDCTKCICFFFDEHVYLCFLQYVCFPWKRTKNCWVRTLPTLVPPNMSWFPVLGLVDVGWHHIPIYRWCSNWRNCW